MMLLNYINPLIRVKQKTKNQINSSKIMCHQYMDPLHTGQTS